MVQGPNLTRLVSATKQFPSHDKIWPRYSFVHCFRQQKRYMIVIPCLYERRIDTSKMCQILTWQLQPRVLFFRVAIITCAWLTENYHHSGYGVTTEKLSAVATLRKYIYVVAVWCQGIVINKSLICILRIPSTIAAYRLKSATKARDAIICFCIAFKWLHLWSAVNNGSPEFINIHGST